jgi:hypothetical protein
MSQSIAVEKPSQWWWATKDMGVVPADPDRWGRLDHEPADLRWDIIGTTVADTVREAEDRLASRILNPDQELLHEPVAVALPDDLSPDERTIVREWVSELHCPEGSPELLANGARRLEAAWKASPGLVLPIRSHALHQLEDALGDGVDAGHLEAAAADVESTVAWFQEPERTAYQQGVNQGHLRQLDRAEDLVTATRINRLSSSAAGGPAPQPWPRPGTGVNGSPGHQPSV